MSLRSKSLRDLIVQGVAVAALLAGVAWHSDAARSALAAGPFDGLSGTWSGGGTISMNTGARERIRCRVQYVVQNSGNNVQQDLRCASDSYRFDLVANVAHSGGSISGTWSESSRGVGGNIFGNARGGQINAIAQTGSFSANLNISTRGSQQSVTIQSPGQEVSEVAITLKKGGR